MSRRDGLIPERPDLIRPKFDVVGLGENAGAPTDPTLRVHLMLVVDATTESASVDLALACVSLPKQIGRKIAHL
jgi:hypothetical protein